MRFRELVVRNIASPYGLAAISTALFLFAWVFPPGIYSACVREPDLMFLDPVSLLFFLLCVLAFVAGLKTVDFFFPVAGFSRGRISTKISPIWFLSIPLIVGIVFTVVSIIILIRNNFNLIDLLLEAQGEQVKDDLDSSGAFGLASVGLTGIVWWASWRKHQLDLTGWRRGVVNVTLTIAILSMLASAAVKLGRGEFMPILAGIAIMFLLNKFIGGKLVLSSVFRYAVGFTALVVVSFASFSVARGLNDAQSLIGNLLGYTIASYNRLAALLDGRLHYPFFGQGIYISSFLTFNDTFNKLIPLSKILDWPDFQTLWRSEFGAVTTAGLNGDLIWSGTFGYIFSDLAWLSPALLFAYGLMTGWVWRSLKLGRPVGIVLYPWFAFCILFWFGTNFLLGTQVFVLLIVAILLGLYEMALVRTTQRCHSGSGLA